MWTTMQTLLLVALVSFVACDGAGGHHAAPPPADGNSHYAVYYHEDQGAPPEQVAVAAAPPPAAPIQAAPLHESSYMSYVPVEEELYPVEELGTKGAADGKLFDVNTILKIVFLIILGIVVTPYVLSWFGITDLSVIGLGRNLESMITENVSTNDLLYYGDLIYKAISKEY